MPVKVLDDEGGVRLEVASVCFVLSLLVALC